MGMDLKFGVQIMQAYQCPLELSPLTSKVEWRKLEIDKIRQDNFINVRLMTNGIDEYKDVITKQEYQKVSHKRQDAESKVE
jgi:hypothetical protein